MNVLCFKTHVYRICSSICTVICISIRIHITIHRKKRFTSFPSPAGMSLTKLPLGRNNSVMTSLFPPRESWVVTSRLGTGNLRTFFLRCRYQFVNIFICINIILVLISCITRTFLNHLTTLFQNQTYICSFIYFPKCCTIGRNLTLCQHS
jgi:hypothetical protein